MQNSWCCDPDEGQLLFLGFFVVFQVLLHSIWTGKVSADDPWSRTGILKKSKPSQQHHPLSVRLYSLQIQAPRIPGLSRPFNNLVWDRSLEITWIRDPSESSEKRHKMSNRFIRMVPHISGIPVKQRRMHKTNKLKKYRSYGEKQQYPETISVKLHYLIPKYRIHDTMIAKIEKQRQTS